MPAKRRTVLSGIGTGTALLLGGATVVGAEDDESEDEAALRVAHASPDAPNVDVYVDGTKVIGDLAFRSVTDYLEIPEGEYEVAVTVAGTDQSVFGPAEIELDGEDYTAVALGEVTEGSDTDFTVGIFQDTNGANLADDEARVRAIHASPDAPSVDVTASTDGEDDPELVVFDGVERFTTNGYTTVPAGVEFDLQIRGDTDTDDGPIVGTVEDLVLEGGSTYTAFAEGYLTPDDDPSEEGFGLVLTEDASAPPRRGRGRGDEDDEDEDDDEE